MAVNKRESENEFCHNPAENNRISCKRLRYEQHGLLSWRKRWREQRPDDPIPPLRVELLRRLRLPSDTNVSGLELDWDEGWWGFVPREAIAITGAGFSLASAPATFVVAALLRLA
ncbi:MAG: hypothetical protein LC808_25210 [Actinobacteria bacterium]|nr:hypothetical protein [Actinomycetota bacterium]